MAYFWGDDRYRADGTHSRDRSSAVISRGLRSNVFAQDEPKSEYYNGIRAEGDVNANDEIGKKVLLMSC